MPWLPTARRRGLIAGSPAEWTASPRAGRTCTLLGGVAWPEAVFPTAGTPTGHQNDADGKEAGYTQTCVPRTDHKECISSQTAVGACYSRRQSTRCFQCGCQLPPIATTRKTREHKRTHFRHPRTDILLSPTVIWPSCYLSYLCIFLSLALLPPPPGVACATREVSPRNPPGPSVVGGFRGCQADRRKRRLADHGRLVDVRVPRCSNLGEASGASGWARDHRGNAGWIATLEGCSRCVAAVVDGDS